MVFSTAPPTKSSKNFNMSRTQLRASSLVPAPENTSHLSSVNSIGFQLNTESTILLITYKALNSLAPPYLADLLHHHAPSRFLRSISANLLQVPRTERRTWGDRAFSVAAPTLWNSLPSHIKVSPTLSSFKSVLKTYLFTLAFPT